MAEEGSGARGRGGRGRPHEPCPDPKPSPSQGAEAQPTVSRRRRFVTMRAPQHGEQHGAVLELRAPRWLDADSLGRSTTATAGLRKRHPRAADTRHVLGVWVDRVHVAGTIGANDPHHFQHVEKAATGAGQQWLRDSSGLRRMGRSHQHGDGTGRAGDGRLRARRCWKGPGPGLHCEGGSAKARPETILGCSVAESVIAHVGTASRPWPTSWDCLL